MSRCGAFRQRALSGIEKGWFGLSYGRFIHERRRERKDTRDMLAERCPDLADDPFALVALSKLRVAARAVTPAMVRREMVAMMERLGL